MQNFDEIIQQYATKIISTENERIVKYQLKQVYRRRNINIYNEVAPPPEAKEYKQSNLRPVRTPYGDFRSLRSAALGSEMEPSTLHKYLKLKKEGYEYL